MVKKNFAKIPRKIGLLLIKPIYLFTITLIAIISFYLYIFGETKTIELIKEEYLWILALIPLSAILIYFKIKLKGYELIDFNKNSTPSLKSTIIFFLIFQVIDYYMEDGFLGMISQWFIYWIIGVFAVLMMENINYYKNYYLILKRVKKD